MARKLISFDDLLVRALHLWDKQWLLLTAGDFATGHSNTMTIGWGSLGTMWGRPFAQVVMRPVRYTFQFMERYDTFTLCAFAQDYRRALNLLGTRTTIGYISARSWPSMGRGRMGNNPRLNNGSEPLGDGFPAEANYV